MNSKLICSLIYIIFDFNIQQFENLHYYRSSFIIESNTFLIIGVNHNQPQMNNKKDKQHEGLQISQNMKKLKKQKNPYNINISFNINNPKKVISNQFNKTIKIHNYNLNNNESNTSRSNNKPSCSNNFINSATATKYHQSTSLPKSKQLSKYECYLENNESPVYCKNKKKSKQKSYDLQTKSKSDFTYSTSILNMPFPGDDPMPSSAVKKINKMKRYFLQKIGSMDITMTDQYLDSKPFQSKDLKYPDLKYELQPKQPQATTKHQTHKKQDDIMTQKLSQYQYENLISFQKDQQQSQMNSVLRSKQILLQQKSDDKFPQNIIQSINCMSVKNQYLRNHSKFIDSNMAIFSKTGGNKVHKKSKGNIKNSSFDDFALFTLKSKLLQQNYSPNGTSKRKKHLPKTSKSDKGINEVKNMKEKIQIMQDLLLKNQSSRSLLMNENGKKKNISEDSQFEIKNKKQREEQNSYGIKTQIQLSNQIINQIKSFQYQKQNQQLIGSKSVISPTNTITPNRQKINFEQFLNDRNRQGQYKQTKDLIQNYIDLLNEKFTDSGRIRDSNFLEDVSNYESILKQPSFSDEINCLSSINDSHTESSVEQRIQISKLPFNHLGMSELNQQSVRSYMREGLQNINAQQISDDYSLQRKQTIEKKIKDDFCNKIQKNALQEPQTLNEKIVETQQKRQNNSLSDIPQNLQFSSLLGFIQQKIAFQETDKKVLEDLYNKLTSVSKIQNFKKMQNTQSPLPIDTYQSVSNHVKSVDENYQKLDKIKTPSNKKNLLSNSSNLHHRRSYSTQRYSSKIQQVFASSDNLNYWDLILVEQKLNKKYNQISYEKQKILLSIELDETLTQHESQNKINQLEEWQNEAKRQILKIKKEIKTGMQRLKNLLTPSQDDIGFKMKSFSERRIFNNVQNKKIGDLKKSQPPITQKIINQNKPSKEYDHQKFTTYQQSPIEVNLHNVLKQIITKQVENNQNILIQNQSNDSSFSQEAQVPRIDLFRTNNKKNLHETTPETPNSSSSDSELYCEKEVRFDQYGGKNNQKQQFVDLLDIEKYKLDDFKILQGSSSPNIIKDFNPTEQDKIDICEFILLDLCIQLYQDSLDLEESNIKKRKHQNNGPNRIIKDIFNFIKLEKKKPKKKGPKIGIHTQLSTVKEYVEKIKTFIENLEQKATSTKNCSKKGLVIDRINVSIGPTAAQILKSMRFQEHEAFSNRQEQTGIQNSQSEELNSLILPVYVFTDFEERIQNDKQFVFDKYFDDAQKQKNRLAFLKNVTHVHHKAMFDALNEMLDFERPFGIWGRPFPWKNKNDKEKPLSQDKLKVSLKNSCTKVVQCAMYMCGLLIDKQESLIKNTSVSQSYIQQVKQDRMSKMIINDFLQTQSKFYFFDDEEAQILLETSYVIWVILLQQALIEILQISSQRGI